MTVTKKRSLPGTGKLRPFIYKMRDGELLWVVLFQDEIRYKTASHQLALYYAITVAAIWAEPK